MLIVVVVTFLYIYYKSHWILSQYFLLFFKMIKLFSLKQQKKDGTDGGERSGNQKKASAAQLRIQKG